MYAINLKMEWMNESIYDGRGVDTSKIRTVPDREDSTDLDESG